MTCLERIECLKAATPAVVTLAIALSCGFGVVLIFCGYWSDYAKYLDKLIGTLLIIAGMQEKL